MLRNLNFLVIGLLILAGCQSAAPAATTAVATATSPAATIPAEQAAITAQPTSPQAAIGTSLPSSKVQFTAEDGVELAGTVYSPATPTTDIAVVLAHMRPTDQTSWAEFAGKLAEQGITALTFDFRGYGESSGTVDVGVLDVDLRAALKFLRDNGYTRLVCIGASMGGTACARDSHEEGIVGLAILSSPLEMDQKLSLTEADFSDLAYPKLFVDSEKDTPYVDDVRQMAEWSPEPKQVQIYSGDAHGTFLFGTEHGGELTQLLLSFVQGLE